MLSENDLRELLDFNTAEPVLSIYLNTDPSEGNADTHQLRLRSMIKEINLTKDVEAIERYFDHEYNWSGRGAAIFSCQPSNFFRVYPLAVPVRNLVHISDRPSVKPLAALLDNYGGYGVVLVDKQGARVFSFHMGELREQEGVLGEAVRRTKHSGGGSAMPGRRGESTTSRAVEEVVDRNMKESAEFAIHFFESNHVRRILVGGTEENVKLFCGLLPKAWQSLVMGTFPMSMTASHGEVRARALEVGLQVETGREKRLVERLITQAAKASGAVTGLEATLNAVNEGRVQTLVISEGFRKNAFRCKGTGWLTTRPEEVCGSEDAEKVYDVVDLAVNQVMRSGGDVEVIMSTAEMDKAGSIGAILRY
jgi:peptide subunit release factor 1 (eRF1)